MKKIFLGIALLLFLFSNDTYSMTQQEAVNKHLSGRKLDSLEGVWSLTQTNQVLLYFKSGNTYQFYDLSYPRYDPGVFQKSTDSYYYGTGAVFYNYNFTNPKFGNQTISINGNYASMVLTIQGQQPINWTMSRIWPENFQAYNANFKSKNDIAEEEKKLAIMVGDAKKTCRVLGFKDNEPKFNDCTLKIYTQKVDDLIQQQKGQSQNQSGTNTNTVIMQGSGGSDNSQEMMDRGLDMLSGRRGVDGSIRSAPSAPIINRQVCTSIVISRNPYTTKEVCR